MKLHIRYRLGLALLLFIIIPASFISAKPDDAAPSSEKITAALQPFVDSNSLAGAVVLVADKDRIININAVGFLDVKAHIKMVVDALFWIASQSKPITAVGLMMLVDQGKVGLEDPVEKYLPEFKGAAPLKWDYKAVAFLAYPENETEAAATQRLNELARDGWQYVGPLGKNLVSFRKARLYDSPPQKILVRHLLTHTSGLPFQSAAEKPTLDRLTLRDAALSYAGTPLQTMPGTKISYSNAGINTAGRIIEVVSGMPYEDYMDKNLFIPLGMKDTTFWPNAEQLKRLAKAYRPNKDNNGLEETLISQLKYPLNDRKRQPMPAGGLFSTARDVARFCQMMLNNGEFQGRRYLSEKAVRQMTSKQTDARVKGTWGLGFSLGGGGSYGHGGALSTNMDIDPKTGMITVFLVQHQGFPGNGGQSSSAFRKAAADVFRAARK